jgi:hypothetical protein
MTGSSFVVTTGSEKYELLRTKSAPKGYISGGVGSFVQFNPEALWRGRLAETVGGTM